MLPLLPDLTHDWELHELARALDVGYPQDDGFTEEIAPFFPNQEHNVVPRLFVTYHCETCGCMFRPDDDGTWWRDRFVFVGEDGSPSCQDWHCACHTIPYTFAATGEHCKVCLAPLYTDHEGDRHHYDDHTTGNDHLPNPVRPAPSPSEMSQARRTLVKVEHDLTE